MTNCLWGQTELDVGLVHLHINDSTVLHFYSKPTDDVPTKTLEFFHDPTIESLNILNLDIQRQWLSPECLWLDYSQFILRCKTQTKDWYEVIVNNKDRQTLWLKKSALTEFSTWESYLNGMFGVSRLADSRQPIRTLPNDQSEEINYTGKDCFQVKSMKGEWIEIFTSDYCEDSYNDSNPKIISGWIKWKQGNILLIEYYITS